MGQKELVEVRRVAITDGAHVAVRHNFHCADGDKAELSENASKKRKRAAL